MNFDQKLERLEDQYNGLFKWLAGQYDPGSGGFYYARSSIGDECFSPDIESTAQALNILLRNHLLERMPAAMRANLVRFFREKQERDTGYFYDRNPAMRQDEVMVHRALNYSAGSMKKLGSEPLYPLPYAARKAPDYAESTEAYLEKWKSIDLSNSWRGCDLLSSSCVYIGQMPIDRQQPFIDEATRYLAGIQDPDTGLWGGGSLYVRISGTFKLHTFYSRFGIPMPRKEKMYESILTCLRSEEAKDMCYIRNPIDLLAYLALDIPDEELAEIFDITIANIVKLKRPDGAFSREIGRSPSAPNVAQVKEDEFYPYMPKPVHLSKGLREGDMNASTQATLIRLQLHRLAGKEAPPLKEAAKFYDHLVTRRAVQPPC